MMETTYLDYNTFMPIVGSITIYIFKKVTNMIQTKRLCISRSTKFCYDINITPLMPNSYAYGFIRSKARRLLKKAGELFKKGGGLFLKGGSDLTFTESGVQILF